MRLRAPSNPFNCISLIIFAVLVSLAPLSLIRGLSWPRTFQQAEAWTRDDNLTADVGSGRILALYQITIDSFWEDIVRDQVTKLIFSGLYAELAFVHCTVFGAHPNASTDASAQLRVYGNKFVIVGLPGLPDISQSIASMDNLNATDRVLFLSTYGGADIDKSDASIAEFQWRTFMEYKLIKEYRPCLQLIQQKHAVGKSRCPHSSCFGFSPVSGGNASFWWADGQTLLSYSTEGSKVLRKMHLLSEKGSRQSFIHLLPRSSIGHSKLHGSNSPASYVDDVKPLANPCTRDGILDLNSTKGDCKVYVFHHLYIVNNWREVLIDQLVKLIFSGLYDRATAIYATLSGLDAGLMDEAAQLLNSFGSKFTIVDQQLNNTQYERLTLYQIKKLVTEKDLIYYWHLKGVSGSMVFNGKAEDRQQGAMARNIYYWRNVMEFFLMRHQKDCVSLLDPSGEDPAGYDAVGINWRPTPSRHFSGNFWWTTGKHWFQLPDVIGDNYIDPEMFLLSRGQCRVATLWNSNIGYDRDYNPREYTDVDNLSVGREQCQD